jgi:hypothetical protein
LVVVHALVVGRQREERGYQLLVACFTSSTSLACATCTLLPPSPLLPAPPTPNPAFLHPPYLEQRLQMGLLEAQTLLALLV